MFFQFGLKHFKQGEGIGCGASKTSQNFVAVQTPDFAGIGFHYGVAQGDLAISANHHLFIVAVADYGGAAVVVHGFFHVVLV